MQNTSILYRVIFCAYIFKDYAYFRFFFIPQKATAIILLHNRFTKIKKKVYEKMREENMLGHELCLTCA